MTILLNSLRNSDAAILVEIAKFWGIDTGRLDFHQLPDAIHTAMLDSTLAEQVWNKLNDQQRGGLQTLLGASGHKMPASMFERLHGLIRKLGAGGIEREQPLEKPASIAEALFYQGLIYDGFEQTPTGLRPIIYIPAELATSLPTHQTAYDYREIEFPEDQLLDDQHLKIATIPPSALTNTHPADTTIVDDLTTLLGYLQIHGGEITAEADLAEADRATIAPYLLNDDPARLTFLFQLGISANLLDAQGKQIIPRRAEVRRWLEDKRPDQLKLLVDAWRKSTIYRDLWFVPGLYPEPTGWLYDPVVGREALVSFLNDFAPRQTWWSPDEFINAIKETEPDFQRPGGSYDSWYIRDAEGEYLSGFASWDAIEGALLQFYLTGPLHWLGMLDWAENAVRLTAYGRAFVGWEDWPAPQAPEETVIVKEDGALLISRRVPGIDRFQAMRFTSWEKAGDGSPYIYKLDAKGIQQAAEQGINTGHIQTFLTRVLGDAPIPPAIAQLLGVWQAGPSAGVTLERLLVLRTTAPETLDFIVNTPALRRYLGARLGDMAVVVRADQWQALCEALGKQGITVAGTEIL